MAIKLNIKELVEVSSPANDHYSVTATLQLVEDGVVVAEKPVTVTGFRYEANSLKEAVKGKLKDAGIEWREQHVKAKLMAKQLEGIAGEM